MNENTIAKVTCSVAYDGSSLADSGMDVIDLTEALLDTSDLFTSTRKFVYLSWTMMEFRLKHS